MPVTVTASLVPTVMVTTWVASMSVRPLLVAVTVVAVGAKVSPVKAEGVAGRAIVAGDIGVARGIDLHRTHFGIGRIRREGRGVDVLVGAR